MGLLPKKPKLTIEQQVAKNVAEFGLAEALGGYEFLARGYGGRAFAGLFRGIGERGLAILNEPPYAPKPHPILGTPKKKSKTASAIKRRKGRAGTILTGGLGGTGTSHKTLLGD